MTTNELKPGQIGTVVQVQSSPAIQQRLLDMGILPNVRIQVERTTAAGDPIWLRIQNVQIALRKIEAEGVSVELVE